MKAWKQQSTGGNSDGKSKAKMHNSKQQATWVSTSTGTAARQGWWWHHHRQLIGGNISNLALWHIISEISISIMGHWHQQQEIVLQQVASDSVHSMPASNRRNDLTATINWGQWCMTKGNSNTSSGSQVSDSSIAQPAKITTTIKNKHQLAAIATTSTALVIMAALATYTAVTGESHCNSRSTLLQKH